MTTMTEVQSLKYPPAMVQSQRHLACIQAILSWGNSMAHFTYTTDLTCYISHSVFFLAFLF